MGSGVLIKRAIEKYGIHNFEKQIIQMYDTYHEALIAERQVVSKDFIEQSDNYNLKEGGYGGCGWSSEAIRRMSDAKKKMWSDPIIATRLRRQIYTPERSAKISRALRGKSKQNPQNKSPEKIRKTALAHTGMKRSIIAKENMSKAARARPDHIKKRIAGKGMIYIYNTDTKIAKRVQSTTDIVAPWVRGSGPKKIEKNTYWGYNTTSLQIKRFKSTEDLPLGWKRGRPPRQSKPH